MEPLVSASSAGPFGCAAAGAPTPALPWQEQLAARAELSGV